MHQVSICVDLKFTKLNFMYTHIDLVYNIIYVNIQVIRVSCQT